MVTEKIRVSASSVISSAADVANMPASRTGEEIFEAGCVSCVMDSSSVARLDRLRRGKLAGKLIPVRLHQGLETSLEQSAVETQRVLPAGGGRVPREIALETAHGRGQGLGRLLREQQTRGTGRVLSADDVERTPFGVRDDGRAAGLRFGHDDA